MKLDSITLEIRWHYDNPGQNFDKNYTADTQTFNVEFDANNVTIDIVPVGGVLRVPPDTHYASFWTQRNEQEETSKLFCTIDFKGDLVPSYELDLESYWNILGKDNIEQNQKENLD